MLMANDQIDSIILTSNDSNCDLKIERIEDKMFIRYVILSNFDNSISEFIKEQDLDK